MAASAAGPPCCLSAAACFCLAERQAADWLFWGPPYPCLYPCPWAGISRPPPHRLNRREGVHPLARVSVGAHAGRREGAQGSEGSAGPLSDCAGQWGRVSTPDRVRRQKSASAARQHVTVTTSTPESLSRSGKVLVSAQCPGKLDTSTEGPAMSIEGCGRRSSLRRETEPAVQSAAFFRAEVCPASLYQKLEPGLAGRFRGPRQNVHLWSLLGSPYSMLSGRGRENSRRPPPAAPAGQSLRSWPDICAAGKGYCLCRAQSSPSSRRRHFLVLACQYTISLHRLQKRPAV